MADPVTGLAAVAAASSIIQVIHFSASCIAEITKLWASDEPGLREYVALEHSTIQQQSFAALLLNFYSDPSRSPSAVKDEVEVIAKEVKEEARILLDLLRSVKLQQGLRGVKKKWNVCVQTVKAFKKRKTIEAHKSRLQETSARLVTALLQVLANTLSRWPRNLNLTLMQGLEAMSGAIEEVGTRSASRLLELQRTLLQATKDHASRLETHIDEGFGDLRDAAMTKKILDSLWSHDMDSRKDAIVDAHAQTFNWVFEDDSSSLSKWLSSGSGIFWVQGRAGSGKSTFMKYVAASEITQRVLTQWAEGDRLVVVDAYIWNAGTVLQKTVNGLLRAALFQILSTNTDLVKIATRGRSMKGGLHETWSNHQLWEALMNVISDPSESIHFCFLIDGLDELHGDRTELVETIKRLAETPRVKVCASSRPWNVFRNAFGVLHPSLCLQDLTLNDIRCFVRQELGAAIRGNPQHQELADSIVAKAQGVFLWVFLVVRSLREGFGEGDDFGIMRRRVEEFPAELGEYFRRILARLSPTYQIRTFQILATAIALSKMDMPPMFPMFWLLQQGVEDPTFAFQQETTVLSDDEFYDMGINTQSFLNACCKDFLHVPKISSETKFGAWKCQVQFLHRTVYDFFDTEEMRCAIHANVPDFYQSPTFVCHLVTAQAHLIPKERCHDDFLRHVIERAAELPGGRTLQVATALETASIRHLKARGKDPRVLDYDRGLALCYFVAFGLRDYLTELIRIDPYISFAWSSYVWMPQCVLGTSRFRSFSIAEIDVDVAMMLEEHGIQVTGRMREFAAALDKEHRLDHPNLSILLEKAAKLARWMIEKWDEPCEEASGGEGLIQDTVDCEPLDADAESAELMEDTRDSEPPDDEEFEDGEYDGGAYDITQSREFRIFQRLVPEAFDGWVQSRP